MESKGLSRSGVQWQAPKTLGEMTRQNQTKGGTGAWAALEVKDPKKIEKLVGKYKTQRTRDFDSQITNLPGPKGITRRYCEEMTYKGLKRHDVKKRDNQAYISNIDDKFNAHKVDTRVFPSHKKAEKPLDACNRRKDYDLKKFVLSETYDFLNPARSSARPC